MIPEIINNFEGDESNTILTLCRIQYTIIEGSIVSKDVAGKYIRSKFSKKEQQIIDIAIMTVYEYDKLSFFDKLYYN